MRLVGAILIGAVLAGATCGGAQAQSWPNRPVKIIVPLAPGGAADILGRIIAEHLSIAFGQQFYVENRASGGGVVGTAAGAAAEPDGYTLVVSSIAANVIAPAFNGHLGYGGVRDFTHIAYLGGPPAAMLVHPALGAPTFQDFVALARAAKEPMSCGSAGAGSHGSLIAEYVARREKYRINHIPYKGAGPALTDLIAGHIELATMTLSTAAEQIRAGRVMALAVASQARMAGFSRYSDLQGIGPGSGCRDLVCTFGAKGAAAIHRERAQPRDPQSNAIAGAAAAARIRWHRDKADVSAGVHSFRGSRDRAMGAAGEVARRGKCGAIVCEHRQLPLSILHDTIK
jgi:tripartite-type tricarboxylate transporter receptor subunit TctC